MDQPIGRPPPEHLPGEVELRPRRSAVGVLVGRVATLGLVLLVALPFWPLYLALRLVAARPPDVFSLARGLRCLRLIATERTEPPLTTATRVSLALSLLTRWAASPVRGLAWYLDELLYGRALASVRIEAPLFEISAARSGSTQLAHYLEDAPGVVAPSVLQIVLPYVWLWKLAAPALGRVVSEDQVRRLAAHVMPKEYLERHEMDPLRTDTLEMAFFLQVQLGEIFMALGPRVLKEEISPARVAEVNAELWARDFLQLIDRLGKKTLLYARARDPEARPRLMMKGHFLAVAAALAERYPDARFLTVLRAPDERIRSVINFHRCHPSDPLLGALPWAWLVEHALRVELEYCDRELEWYSRDDGVRRTIVRFRDYVRDLEGTLRRVYRECLDVDEPPAEVTRAHAERVRSGYSVDRSLEALGVDRAWLDLRLRDYGAWCASVEGGRAAEAPAVASARGRWRAISGG